MPLRPVNLYSSTDLVNWEFRNSIIDKNSHASLNDGTRWIERPKLIYNSKTDQFVVWVHWEGKNYEPSEAAVFYCDSIDGKYTFHKGWRPFDNMSRDCNLFLDDDGTAYFISAANFNYDLVLYRLTSDYLDVAEQWTLFPGDHREAPVLFKEDNRYFLITSGATGWDSNQGLYSSSTSLTSGWVTWQNFGDDKTFDTQSTSVFSVTGSSGTSHFYVGDRWQDPNLPESKTIILPFQIDNDSLIIDYVKEFTIDINTGTWSESTDNTYLSQNDWSLVSVSSEETSNENAPGIYTIDNDPNTFWHSQWSTGSDIHPHEIVIDLGSTSNVSGFEYIPRRDGNTNGTVSDFQLLFSEDGTNWGIPVVAGKIRYWSEVHFAETSARYMKFVSRSEIHEYGIASAAELKLLTNNEFQSSSITPLYHIDRGSWNEGYTIEVNAGSTVKIGPRPLHYGSYSWVGPDGFYSGNREIALSRITASQGGVYTVYYLDDQFNCSAHSIEVNVLLHPIADFEANSTTVNEGECVNFIDQSINNPTSWSWTFNGGSPSGSTTQSPSVAYSTAGTYDVTLIVSNTFGSDTLTKEISVTTEEILSVGTDPMNNHVEAYPTLAKDLLHISGVKEGTLLKLYNAQGRFITHGSGSVLDVSGFNKGIYLLFVQGEQTPIKFVRQ